MSSKSYAWCLAAHISKFVLIHYNAVLPALMLSQHILCIYYGHEFLCLYTFFLNFHLQVKSSRWHAADASFKGAMKDLEVMLGNVISEAFAPLLEGEGVNLHVGSYAVSMHPAQYASATASITTFYLIFNPFNCCSCLARRFRFVCRGS